tara:strand:+ start:2439 stop:2870 length:432 start_codon:yes stop_codon:yes gene_type:complete
MITVEEKRKTYLKNWVENNIEKVRAYRKAYYKANKGKHNAVTKSYYQSNKNQFVEYYEANRLPYNLVYCIPNYNGKGDDYCGVTDNPVSRMRNHKCIGKVNTDKWYELSRDDCRVKAEAIENDYHLKGYHGSKDKSIYNDTNC